MNRPGICKHFTGIQHGTCAIGVCYRDVMVERLYKGLPCFAADAATSGAKCEKREEPTAEEIAADEAKLKAAFDTILDGKSPCCNAPLTPPEPDGTGPRWCTACKVFVMRGCNPSEIPAFEQDDS